MASKDLTARVRLNTTQAEKNIDRLVNKINQINNVLNKTSNGSSSQIPKNIKNATTETQKWANALNTVNGKLNGSKSLIKSIGGGLKTLADRYLGVMGMGVVINTSDAITSAENKLNYINGGDTTLTKDAMDKMYTSAQKVRMGYTDMMSNVSKSMALAGDSFKGSTDMAIRFQEIMAEAYAVGGASAQEMSSSMYQLIQALGAGVLAGDELRSVREGAPLAYKEIEKFAQGVYNTEESLKDLASQGKITSDMVVAAIMNAGNEMDSAFAQTEQTFAQTWSQIKNAATRSFMPVAKMLRTALNRAIDNGLIQKFEKFFINVAKGIMIVFKIIEKVITWVVDNWGWLQHIVIAGLMLMITWTIIKAGISIACAYMELKAWMLANKVTWATIGALAKVLGVIAIIIMAVMALIYVFYLWKTGAIDTCTAIVIALLIVAAAILLIGILTGNVVMVIIAIIIALVAIIFMYLEYVAGGITWFGMLCKNIGLAVANFFIAIALWVAAAFMNCIEWIVTAFNNAVNWIVNFAMGLWNSIKAIAQNIGIAFENAWIGAQNAFWSFIQGCLEGIKWLEPAINAIAEAFGIEGFTLSGVIDNVAGKQKSYKEFVSVGDAWNTGYHTREYESGNYQNLGDAWNKGINTFDVFEKGWSQEAFDIGYDWGKGVKDSVNQWGSQFQSSGENDPWLDNLGKELGLDMTQFDNLFGDNGNGVGGDFGDLLGDTGDIAGNTGKMADSMDLTEEDLKYIRSIAEMEWKKEYTTAEIKVEMTNNNNINGESDLDGIVTKLSDKLYEELNIIADGVYAY